jgi:hypothetical protein
VTKAATKQRILTLVLTALAVQALSGCYFFRKRKAGEQSQSVAAGAVIGRAMGARAGSIDEQALQDLYALSTDIPPAAIRPDPDTVVRQLLLQYRGEGSTVAREIGRVEQFRLLLGGATEDFSKPPQDTYDATSLLAIYQVAEEVCVGLVAPDNRHPGWSSILPHGASDVEPNIRFLAQRITGLPTSEISDESLDLLHDIFTTARAGATDYADYVPVCAALVVDAEALLL